MVFPTRHQNKVESEDVVDPRRVKIKSTSLTPGGSSRDRILFMEKVEVEVWVGVEQEMMIKASITWPKQEHPLN